MVPTCYLIARNGVTHITLEQRIQQLRKEHGLSQEALGEQLGDSRMAIFKGESKVLLT